MTEADRTPWQWPAPAPAGSTDGVVDLTQLAQDLLTQARADAHGKAAMKVLGDATQRVMLIALTTQGKLAEHSSPPAATLHTLTGRMRLHCGNSGTGDSGAGQSGTGGQEWVVGPGQVVAIPPERHAVDCVEDGVFMLTVSLIGRDAG